MPHRPHNDHENPHRAGYHGGPLDGIAFDDEGDLVPIVAPAVYGSDVPGPPADTEARRGRQEDFLRMLDWLTSSGRAGALAIGRRALIVRHALRPEGTQAALARRLGVSPAAVSKAVNALLSGNPYEH